MRQSSAHLLLTMVVVLFTGSAQAVIYGWTWNQLPPQYASVGDTFEVSATYLTPPPSSVAYQASFVISDPNFPYGFDPNGASVSWGTVRTVNGKKYQPITITKAGNGSLCITATKSGYSDFPHILAR